VSEEKSALHSYQYRSEAMLAISLRLRLMREVQGIRQGTSRKRKMPQSKSAGSDVEEVEGLVTLGSEEVNMLRLDAVEDGAVDKATGQ